MSEPLSHLRSALAPLTPLADSAHHALHRSFSRDAAHARVALHGLLRVRVARALGLSAGERSLVGLLERVVSDASDTYAEVCAGPRRLLKTSVCHGGGSDPEWNEEAAVDVADLHDVLTVTVYASAGINLGRISKPRTLGFCEIRVGQIERGGVECQYELRSKHRRGKAGCIWLSIEMECLEDVVARARARPDYAVPNTYFPLRKGCVVTMYQDAHAPAGCLPGVVDFAMRKYEPRCAWLEIYNAMLGAEKVIYIAGWSLLTELVMVRDAEAVAEGGLPMSIGELLKRKADEGVQVSVLIWDEITSQDMLLGYVKTGGVMGTMDEETYNFFKETKVVCAKVSRIDDGTNGIFGGVAVGGLWSHHMKFVIADRDCPLDRRRRRIVAYLGGLDLTFGRYDDPRHRIFRSLKTTHKDDFFNGCFTGSSEETGPREPWHDVHCCVEGAAAWDIVRTFEDRWRQQAPKSAASALRRMTHEEFVSGVEETEAISRMPDSFYVQLFRSIDERSITYDHPPPGSLGMSLGTKKGRLVEAHVVRAYIHHIRMAERFLYIENQYFMGGSAMWDSSLQTVSDNLIPIEIVLKIEEKIRLREEFAVYVVLPLFPEGTSAIAVGEVLKWQFKTIQMMYRRIAAAISENGRVGDVSPTDYLSFFCLGQRESPVGGQETRCPDASSSAYSGFMARRHMIYVHSKAMIVDDCVAVIGSANINTRSMAGTRDSEIAMATYQPAHTRELAKKAGLEVPRGQVHCFRMSLFAEHLGYVEDLFMFPWTRACMKIVRKRALHNWLAFDAPASPGTNVDMPAHLMLYPYEVSRDGDVTARCEKIPDFPGVPVLGRNALLLPDIGTG